MKSYFLFLLAFTLSFSSFAQERLSVKEFTLGQPVPAGKCPNKTKPYGQKDTMYEKLWRFCLSEEKTYANAPANIILMVMVESNKIEGALIVFKEKNSYSGVKLAIEEKYGKPGLENNNETMWRIKNDMIRIDKTMVGTASALIMDIRIIENSGNDKPKKDAKDL